MLLLFGLLLLGAFAYHVLFRTPLGHQIRQRDAVHAWVARHRVLAPLALVGVYVAASILLLPVWWVQVLGGYCFGLFMGIIWCDLGAMIGAMLSVRLSRWLVGEWFRERYESRMERIRRIDEKLGNNGILVVLAVRLSHVAPFGISNYLFGLTRITIFDAGLGTLAGNLPAVAIYVAGGVGPHVLRDWRFWAAVIGTNLLLLVPIAYRYRQHRRESDGPSK